MWGKIIEEQKKICESQEWNFEDLKYKPWSNLAGGSSEKDKKFSRKIIKNTMT